MSETNLGAPSKTEEATKKSCRTCGEPISSSASKCVHCQSWQDWRSMFATSTTVLSLLVALISVTTAALPTIVGLLTPKRSELSFSFQGVAGPDDQLTLQFLGSNSGTKPGSVRGATYLKGLRWISRSFHLSSSQQDRSAIILEPGKAELLSFSLDRGAVLDSPPDLTRCDLHILYSNFDGTDGRFPITVDCARLVRMFNPLGKQRIYDQEKRARRSAN